MIDSHCHLAGEEFAADLADVVSRAQDAGVTSALCILSAVDPAELEAAGRLRGVWNGVRFAAGVHPHAAGSFADRLATVTDVVESAAAQVGACAIGEIGLDYHYDFSPRDIQHEVFAAQIRLARARGLPVVIHTREADHDTLGLLREHGGGEVRGVFHCFTGDLAMARAALELGFHISFSGILTFPKANELREVARVVPDDRFLVETDSPYLAPVPHRGQRNEPAMVSRVVEVLAEVRGVSAGEVAATAARNFEELFVRVNPRSSKGLAR